MSVLDTLAGCYETAAAAALLLHSLSGRPGSLAQGITFLAEAQSASGPRSRPSVGLRTPTSSNSSSSFGLPPRVSRFFFPDS